MNRDDWKPLEDAIGTRACCAYMFMGRVEQDGTTIHLYKHRDTRRYLNVDAQGCGWRYDGARYVPADAPALTHERIESARAFPDERGAA